MAGPRRGLIGRYYGFTVILALAVGVAFGLASAEVSHPLPWLDPDRDWPVGCLETVEGPARRNLQLPSRYGSHNGPICAYDSLHSWADLGDRDGRGESGAPGRR